MTRPVVVLVGPPGAGKTTVGQLVARRLGVAFRDTDADVEAETGTSIADLFIVHGEPAFRELERAAVSRALAEHDGVLALGGGAVLDQETRQALRRAGHVVYLDVDAGEAAGRVGFNRGRPLLLGNPRRRLAELLEQRRPLYAEVATLTVTTDGRSPDDVADEVVGSLP